jgi:hypothetical protein
MTVNEGMVEPNNFDDFESTRLSEMSTVGAHHPVGCCALLAGRACRQSARDP